MISPCIKKLIEANAMGLATIGKNGKPHNIAVACVKVEGDLVIISNTHIKESVKNIQQNKNVSLVVWNKEWEKACVGFELIGQAKNYTSGKWFDYVCRLRENKGYKLKSVIIVKITKIKKLLS
ncbi:MAG: pyridoxamine 5'-phosphate oxidase family protein [Candidatus Moranbacteria bacterium]|nr:pyridoxamine 5'-phosphate oxidase family protein [Candidatus Moranbacteria bacterium]